MSPRISVSLSLVLLGIGVLGWQTFSFQAAAGAASHEIDLGASAVTPRDNTNANTAVDVVNLERAKSDAAYQMGPLRRHCAIKSYLASPIKGDETMEKVLCFLLEHGYSIEDLQSVYITIRILAMRLPEATSFNESLRQHGVPEEQFAEKYQKALQFSRRRVTRILQSAIGVDEAAATELAALIPQDRQPLGPASDFLPDVAPVNGERLLTDSDWMTEHHKQAVQKYDGEPRSIHNRKIPTEGPTMMPRIIKRDLD